MARADQYRWSSLRHYLAAQGHPPWLDTRTVLGPFAGWRKVFLACTREQPEAELMGLERAGRGGPILGTEALKAWLRTRRPPRRTDREIPERRHLAVPLPACLAAVARAYRVPEDVLVRSRRGVPNLARQVALYMCREVGGYSHREIAERLRAGSYSTVSSVCAMLKKRLGEDRDLQRQLARIRRQLLGEYGQQAT